MSRVYCIGKFQFKSYEKYREALDDVEKIRSISKKMDINEPGVAQRLYSLIREGKIVFKSPIGDDYLLYLCDMVAEDYKVLSKTSFGGQIIKKIKNLSFGQVVGAICMAGAVVCFLIFIGSEYHDRQKTRELEELRNEQEISAASDWLSAKFIDTIKEDDVAGVPVLAQTETVENETYAVNLPEEEPEKTEESEKAEEGEEESDTPAILEEYKTLYEKNADFAGWITIEGTEIDYPVMKAVPESSDFYLDHDFNGNEDINGSIFIDFRNNLKEQDDNLIIYGHNMKSGMMFGELERYLDKDYLEEHKKITFNTIYEKAEYEIIAVCLSKAVDGEEESFHYYDFIKAGNKKSFNRYIKNISKLNVMGGDVEASYGDKLLTLSTCNNYTKDGRLFLVARKCTP